MKFAYLILAHKNPRQLKRLIKALDNENCLFIIHVDNNVQIYPFVKELNTPLKGQLHFTKERKNVYWGRYSMIEAEMVLLKEFFELSFNADYIHLLSGQDYPIASNTEIFDFFKSNKGQNFMSFFSLPYERWADFPSRIDFRWGVNKDGEFWHSNIDYYHQNAKAHSLPKDIKPYGGGQWWSLQYDCLHYVYNLYQNKHEIFSFYRFTFIADEMVFQTILLNSEFKDTIKNDNLRYIKWNENKAHPETIELSDIDNFFSGQYLFARKFSAFNDEILDKLDEKLTDKKENDTSLNVKRKYCVITPIGKGSMHRSWISEINQYYDLHLLVYDDSYEEFKTDSSFVFKVNGYKLKVVHDYLQSNKHLLGKYDYFFIPDDDISMNCESINMLFSLMQEYRLDIAQPALINSYYSYEHTIKVPNSVLRYTNFVEMMIPCFSKDALKKVLFTFNENISGWGTEFHWGKLIGSNNYNMAILDDVSVEHLRPIQSQKEENIIEMFDYLQKYNLPNEIIQYQ